MDSTAVPSAVREQRLEEWVTQYGNAVWRACFVYLSDAQQAEDAMQDTFLKAWHAMPQFEGRNGCTEKTWLMRIAMNVCADYKRSKWFRHVDMTKAIEDIPQTACVAPEDRSLFYDIARLPAKYKQVILLYYYQEMTMEETAQALSISRSSVFHRLQKAQALLKQTLTGGDYDGRKPCAESH